MIIPQLLTSHPDQRKGKGSIRSFKIFVIQHNTYKKQFSQNKMYVYVIYIYTVISKEF